MEKIKDFSIGVDIESIVRFKGLQREKSKHFLAKIFTKGELDYCFSKTAPASHLAARFAAKEAVVKAVSSLGQETPNVNEIEISHHANGAPVAALKGHDIKISLSHCGDKAIAFALVQRR